MSDPCEWPTRDLVAHRVAATPQRTALIDVATETEWTVRDFDHRIDRTASVLESTTRGGTDRSRIGVLMGTRPAFATLFFAAMRLGATVVPLNVRETADELAAKVERTDPATIICERATEDVALEIATEIGSINVCSVDDPDHDRIDELMGAAVNGPDTSSSETRSVEPVPLERDETQLIMFTSGTAGEPKAVRLTVGNLVTSATASAFRLGIDPSDRWLCCLPMYHMGGLAPILRSVLYGTTAVIQREFDPKSTVGVLADYDVTGVSLVPTMCKRLLDAGWQPTDAVRFVLIGGAPASAELIERCRERGVPAHPTYGMTETASQIATATPEETANHKGSVGQPLLCTDVSVVENGESVAAGTPGELVVSGPTVTPGYLDEAATAAAFSDRGFHTGDVGYRDENGRLWICNRRSDRIITGGENVDPGEVLAVLRSHPCVEDAAVVGVADQEWGERVAALVVSERAETTDEKPRAIRSLLAHCDEHLAGFKRPKMIGFADSLPRTASGTVDRTAVRNRLLEAGVDVTDSV